MAEIHQHCFPDAWSIDVFCDYFDRPEWSGVFGFAIMHRDEQLDTHPDIPMGTHLSVHDDMQTDAHETLVGFILGRTIYALNDILTFAVDPLYQGKGLGHALLAAYIDALSCDCLLEVATGNTAAIHLYTRLGFETLMTRRNYYEHPDPAMRDAYVMRLSCGRSY